MEALASNGETILVVDDQIDQREIAAEMLEYYGYSVQTVASGEKAIEYVKERDVDLLILDMIMGDGMDGLETFQNILEIRPDQKAIIATGYSETNRIKEARKIGVGAILKKPYLLEQLGLAVKGELCK